MITTDLRPRIPNPGGWAMSDIPRYFYGAFPELERIELGERAAYCYDESSSLMHRLIRAVGGTYDLSHNYWRAR